MLLGNKVETGSAATFDVQKVRVPLASSAYCPWEDHIDKVHEQQFLPQQPLSSKPMSSFANPGTRCSTLQVSII